MDRSLLKRPSAYLPLAMSFAALCLVLVHMARFGAGREADEGTSAHLFQLLMALQLPSVGFFAIRWLPEKPRAALLVLATQAVASSAAFGAVYLMEHQ